MERVAARILKFGLRFMAVLVLLCGRPAWAVNSVVVVSDTVNSGQSGVRIAVKLTNDVSVRNIVIPFVFREVTPGCFPDSVRREIGERLATVLTELKIFDQKYDTIGTCKQGQAGGFVGKALYTLDTLSHEVTPPTECFFLSIGRFVGTNLVPGADISGSVS